VLLSGGCSTACTACGVAQAAGGEACKAQTGTHLCLDARARGCVCAQSQFDAPKTAKLVAGLEAVGADPGDATLLILNEMDTNLLLSARNVAKLEVSPGSTWSGARRSQASPVRQTECFALS
jgi:hypothetical protein